MPAMSIALAIKNRNNYNKDFTYLSMIEDKKRLEEKNRKLWFFKKKLFKIRYYVNKSL